MKIIDPIYLIEQGEWETVRMIIDPIYLIEQGEWETVRMIIDSNKNFDVNKTYIYGETILDVAVRLQLFPVVQYMVNMKGADLTKVHKRLRNGLLQGALKIKDWGMTDFVIKHDESVVNRSHSITKETQLHHFIKTQPDIEIVKYLLENNANVNVENDEGKTPLCCAIEKWNYFYYVDVMFSVDLDQLMRGPRFQFIKVLLEYGAIMDKGKYNFNEVQSELIDRVLFDMASLSIK